MEAYVALICYKTSSGLMTTTQVFEGELDEVLTRYHNLVDEMKTWGTPHVWSVLHDMRNGLEIVSNP